MQFLALFYAPCYHKMAVKEMTPSLALLFPETSGLLAADIRPSAITTLTGLVPVDVS